MCHGFNGIFIGYRRADIPNKMWIVLNLFVYILGKHFGLTNISSTDCGSPPENTRWIMEGSTFEETPSLRWSNCSIETMKKSRETLACLRRKVEPYKSMCGNGFVEDGEECDCISESCKKCCDDHCKLTNRSLCSNGPCCDTSFCGYVDSSVQCRAADDYCDIPELCNGNSSECPANYVVANGYECQGPVNLAYCFNGKCGSRKDMCQWFLKDGTVARETCYDRNLIDNDKLGGCGPTLVNRTIPRTVSYFACNAKDKFCGKLFCQQPGIETSINLLLSQEFTPFRDRMCLENSKN